MSVIIKNITNRPVSLRLNSTRTLHIGPNAASTEIVDVEVNNNSYVQRLLDRHLIDVRKVEKKVAPQRAPKSESPETTSKRAKSETEKEESTTKKK